MNDSAASQPLINDSDFAAAIHSMDQGDLQSLETIVDRRPDLLTITAEEDGSFAGDYFKNPRLIWFVAENPIRKGRLPANIADVATLLINKSKQHGVQDLIEQLNYTLALVTSGKIARESGQQKKLCRALIAGGADPNSGITSALAHGEVEACRLLVDCGAELTLPLAAGLGQQSDLQTLLKSASLETRQHALIMAAINGQHRCARILADNGTDLNAFNPAGMHGHSTPLHQAVQSGCVRTVCTLVTRGADYDIKDTIFHGTADDWARECKHSEIQEFLKRARILMPAVNAVRSGDTTALKDWLSQNAEHINDRLGDNPRTLLHYATDWPGKYPNSGQTIRHLIDAGADPDARLAGDSVTSPETPLHWAASSDDVDAATALIDGGASLNSTGGCIGNGTPLTLAVIFQNWRVARLLVQKGAIVSLPLAAGMGDMDLVQRFFAADGAFRNPFPSMPNVDTVGNQQQQLNGAICCAAMAGHLEIVKLMQSKGADVNAVTTAPTTALDEAINNGHKLVAEYLREQGAVTLAELKASGT